MTAEKETLQKSSRDLDRTRATLTTWLAGKLPAGSAPEVTELTVPPTGQSSETLLFTATWHGHGVRQARRLVARVAPQQVDMPIFPGYQMEREFQVIRSVAQLTGVPVPEAVWIEPDPVTFGTPFFIMGRVDGDIPDDITYNSAGWLFEAGRDEQRLVQETTVSALAALHAAPDPERNFAFLQYPQAGDTALGRHVAHAQAWYDHAVSRGGRCPLIERGFRWLADSWPAGSGETVLSWGDARVNNVIYRDFRPVALLDWEMAGLGPREIDIAWLVGGHRVFEDIAGLFGSPGLPHFLRLEDVATQYEAATGHAIRDIDFYLTYTAIQWAIVFVLAGLRRVHFKEQAMPDDVQDLIINRGSLEQLLAAGGGA
ncbi:MAG: putative aminoglycoside phosphotransferase [Actinomycetia bacterium]|nr:putative aminoglycoside phosphotransferase [Actinomycetes bacterium]